MLRIGFINYLNSKPLYEGLTHPELEVLSAEPKELAELLLKGKLDFGQISSLVFLQNYEVFELYDRFCVAAQTAQINSVLLVSKQPIDKLQGKLIALTSRSSTSSQLLQILLEQFYKVKANYQTSDLTLSSLEDEPAEAFLIIGDQALELWQRSQSGDFAGYHIYDLAELWRNWTGFPFVFAVFVGQKGLKLPKVVANAIWKNSLEPQKIIQKAALVGFQKETLANYYSNISYDLDQTKVESLDLLASYAGISLPKIKVQTIDLSTA